MDETTLKIAIAAFIHDFGDFVDQRAADGDGPDRDDRTEGVAAFLAEVKEHLPECLSDMSLCEKSGFIKSDSQ